MKLLAVNYQLSTKRGFIFELREKRRLKAFISELSKERRPKAFTLVELLVVISLIILLSSIGYASFTQALKMGRDGRRKADLASIRDALELYYAERNSYPSTGGLGTWDKVKNAADGSDNDTLSVNLEPTYMKVVPVDPKQTYGTAGEGPCGGARYGYVYASNGSAYFLAAHVEGTNDHWCGDLPGWTACSGNPPSDCYGVQNP